MKALGITLEEAKVLQEQLEKEQRELQEARDELQRKSDALAAATRSAGGEITDQTSAQITEAQAAEFLQLQQAKTFQRRAMVLVVVGAIGSIGLATWLISRDNRRGAST
jgi:Skp family chaperone for outer membrane proteins